MTTWLLDDLYLTGLAAGAVNGTPATPGPGTRTVTDANGKLSIASNALVLATGGSAAGNPGLWYGVLTRTAGRLLVAKLTASDTAGIAEVGFDSAAAGSINDALLLAASGVLQIRPNNGTVLALGAYTATDYNVAVIMRATGIFVFIKGGAYTNWSLLWRSEAGTGNGYPALAAGSTTTVFSAAYVRVPSELWLPTPLASDGFSTWGATDGLGHAEGVAGGLGAGGSGVTWTGSTWSVVDGKAINTPTLGPELLTNGDFAAWTGDNPDGWTVSGESGSDPEISEVGSGEGHGGAGTGSANIYGTASQTVYMQQSVLAVNGWYKIVAEQSYYAPASNAPYLRDASHGISTYFTVAGTLTITGRAANAAFRINPTGNSTDTTFNSISIKALTLAELMATADFATANVVLGVALEAPSIGLNHVGAGLVLNLDNAANPQNFVICRREKTYVRLDKCVAGTYTNLINTNVTYSAGARLVVTKDGNSYRVYYNNALVGTEQTISDPGIINNTRHGLFSTDPNNTLNDFVCYARGTGGEHVALDAYAIDVDATASLTEAEIMLTADGVAVLYAAAALSEANDAIGAMAGEWTLPTVASTLTGIENGFLPAIISGATVPVYALTWQDSEGDAIDLDGAVLTARFLNLRTGATSTVGGTLTVTTGNTGIFRYAPSAADVATAGIYQIQFSAALPNGGTIRTSAYINIMEAI